MESCEEVAATIAVHQRADLALGRTSLTVTTRSCSDARTAAAKADHHCA